MNDQVTEYIQNAPLEQQKIMETVRSIIFQSIPNAKEEFKWNRPIFKTTKEFCYFQSTKNYATIGFTKDFEKLNDPNNILEGTGKTMRHIKLKKVSDINKELLSDWFTIIATE